jgi:hypothetical protein
MKFTYVLAGWEGSAHDAMILVDSMDCISEEEEEEELKRQHHAVVFYE